MQCQSTRVWTHRAGPISRLSIDCQVQLLRTGIELQVRASLLQSLSSTAFNRHRACAALLLIAPAAGMVQLQGADAHLLPGAATSLPPPPPPPPCRSRQTSFPIGPTPRPSTPSYRSLA